MTDDLKQLHASPETIYLQVDPEGVGPSEWDTLDGATWCTDQINDNDVCYVRSDRIEQLESERDELLACLNLIYSWANNWDSEFMNDPDWKNTDYPRIQATIAKVKGQS